MDFKLSSKLRVKVIALAILLGQHALLIKMNLLELLVRKNTSKLDS